jgi:hypothetical protein
VLLLNPATPTGESAGPSAAEIYKAVPNVTVRMLEAREDPVQVLSAWASGV